MVNLRISESFLSVVYGSARVNVHPYIQWLSLYAETGIKYFGYRNDVLRADMAQFVLSVGVSFDVYIKHKTKPKDSEQITETAETLPKETLPKETPSQEISSADKTDAADKPVETVEIVDTAQNVGIPENEPKQNDAGEDAAAKYLRLYQ